MPICTYNTASEQTTCSGSLQAVQSELNIINSYFYNNSAPYGAAIYAGQSKVNISDTVFLENTAYLGNGGAINLVTSTAMMSRISSFNNSAVGNGGLFNAEQGSRLIVSDLVCVGNKITGSGGCINVIGSDITVNNVRSEYCEALEGGAFSIAENSVLNITNSVISNNYGSSGGGGVFCSQQAEFYGEELVLDGNKADASGGGVSATYGCVFHMVDSVLNGNVIDENAPSSIGGGLYAFGAILVLENITLSYSQGGRGSMLFSQNSLVSIANSDFFFGSSDEYGIYASTATDFSFLNSTYRENKGTLTSSGIMCASTTSCFIYNSVFENNVGKNLGGFKNVF